MADERDGAGEAERPVEPPVIDLEAEEVRAEDAAGSTEASQAAADTAARKSGWPWLNLPTALLAGLIILVIGAGSWAAFTLMPRARPEAADLRLTQRLGALEAASEQTLVQIGELTALLNELKSQPPQQVQSNQAELDALKQQISEIDGRINTLSDTLGDIETSLKAIEGGQGSQQKEIEATAQRIGEMQSQLNAKPVPQQPVNDTTNALAAALVKLKTAAAEGRPFAQELQTLNALSPGTVTADGLQANAARGIATTATLSAQLQEVLAALKTPAAPVETKPGGGVWNTLKAKAASLISIRRLDDAKWIAAAEEAVAQIEKGEVALAVKRIRAVPGDLPPLLMAWLDTAEARLATDRAMEDISADVLKKLGGGA